MSKVDDSSGRTVDLTRRKVVQYVSYGDDYDYSGHGTHVAATAVGRLSLDGQNETDGIADGIARDAKVAFFDLGVKGEGIDFPADSDGLFEPGRRYAGAYIHSGSWSSRPAEEYSFYERDIDSYFYKYDDFLGIFAAGNSGEGTNITGGEMSIGSPGDAKNSITVGSSQNEHDNLSSWLLGIDYIGWFSSRGPTPDGRIKPDIVAPGFPLTSAFPNPDQTTTSSCDNHTANQIGTSMSTPVIAGTAALIRQYFTEGWYPTGRPTPGDEISPSASLIKAVLINGARFVKGVQHLNDTSSTVEPYDGYQGFGRVSLIDSLRLDAGRRRPGDDETKEEEEDNDDDDNHLNVLIRDRIKIRNGQRNTFDIIIGREEAEEDKKCHTREMSVTLVWADPPSFPGCRACVLNNLDLSVIHLKDRRDESITHYPNGRDDRDDVNNVERVRLSQMNEGDRYRIVVKGRNLQSSSQFYSLVVSGCFVAV